MGDEFALLDLETGAIFPFPRLVSFKNRAIDVLAAEAPVQRMGQMLAGTAEGDYRHLVPRGGEVARVTEGGPPARLLFLCSRQHRIGVVRGKVVLGHAAPWTA